MSLSVDDAAYGYMCGPHDGASSCPTNESLALGPSLHHPWNPKTLTLDSAQEKRVANSSGRSEKVSWVLFSTATRSAPPASLHTLA